MKTANTWSHSVFVPVGGRDIAISRESCSRTTRSLRGAEGERVVLIIVLEKKRIPTNALIEKTSFPNVVFPATVRNVRRCAFNRSCFQGNHQAKSYRVPAYQYVVGGRHDVISRSMRSMPATPEPSRLNPPNVVNSSSSLFCDGSVPFCIV